MGTTMLIIGAVIGGFGGVAAILTAIFSRSKDSGDRYDRYTDRLEARLIAVEGRVVAEVERRLVLARRVTQLESALLRAGIPIPDAYEADAVTEARNA